MIDLAVILGGALLLLSLWRSIQNSKRNALLEKIPGPKAYPLIGNMLDLKCPTNETIARIRARKNKYGDILRLWNGPIPSVAITAPEYIEVILSNNQEIKKSFVYNLVRPWLGDGLLTSTGKRWFKHRKLITPTFHFKILDSFLPVFESNGEVLIEKLNKEANKGQPFDICPFITRCALDIICETAMGINLHAQERVHSEYISAVYRFSKLTAERIMRTYYHADFIYSLFPAGKEFKKCVDTMHNFTINVIRERKKKLASSNTEEESDENFGLKKRKAFLDLLLEEKHDLSDNDLREEVDTFMFEGHDTTTAGMSWSIYLLGLHPEIQEEAAAEVLNAWPKGETLTMQHINEMKLLERIIKESLRIYPSVFSFSRQLQNDMKFGEYVVPSGTNIQILTAVLHMDEKIYPNPTKFDPDRFLPENVQKRHPYSYIPFSAGSRNCIGQKFAVIEEKAVLASILREFTIKTMEENVSMAAELILRPENGIKVVLTKRK